MGASAHDEDEADRLRRSAELLASLQHENIVRLHDTLLNRNSSFLVMERYAGGDLIGGIQEFFATNSYLLSCRAVHIGKQMAMAVDYIHSKSIVHRDIKGDNFLLDRKSFVDSECRIALCDFDTALYVEPDQRFWQQSGTRSYWAPEIFKMNYGNKVDVWAMGVTIYSVLSGNALFKNQNQIKNKTPTFGSNIDPVCKDFLQCLLQKVEDERYSSHQAAAHPWILGHLDDDFSYDLKALSDTESTAASSSCSVRDELLVEQAHTFAGDTRVSFFFV